MPGKIRDQRRQGSLDGTRDIAPIGMDHYSILDQTVVLPPIDVRIAEPESAQFEISGSSALDEQSAGHTLAELALADLDATLQLLADRALYITGASGAAIALRRGERQGEHQVVHHDMLCRASAGSNAPELGSLLSMDQGLSGECVRTRRPLRCDDTQQDSRVNRKACLELGIASVVVMPIQSADTILGVFEILSGKPRAFDERDLSTLMRLSQMVETAVKHATGAQSTIRILKKSEAAKSVDLLVQASPANPENADDGRQMQRLFWSAAVGSQSTVQQTSNIERGALSKELANLQNCQTCGFPISQDRTLCVDCEEKRWSGQGKSTSSLQSQSQSQAQAPALPSELPPAGEATKQTGISTKVEEVASTAASSVSVSDSSLDCADRPAPFMNVALESESWFSRNKFIVAALFVIAVIVGILSLR